MKPSDLVDEIVCHVDRASVKNLMAIYESIFDAKCTLSGDEIQVPCLNCKGSGQVMSEGFINLGQGNIKRTEHWHECPECRGKGWR